MKNILRNGAIAVMSFLSLGCSLDKVEAVEYKTEMVNLITEIREYSRHNREDFFLIANGGADLFDTNEDNPQQQIEKYAHNIDGVMAESIFYGYGMETDGATPPEAEEYFKRILGTARQYGVTVLSLDYCAQVDNVKDSYKRNGWQHYVSWASGYRNLTDIPKEVPNNVNKNDIKKLSDIKNYMVILNPENYKTKEIFLNSLADTDYDLLIIDTSYGGADLSKADLERLRYKKNGGKRLIAGYMSLGEAETYRSYWQTEWNDNPPSWIAAANDNWENNFHVKYWSKEWKKILMNPANGYLDKIMAAGFDGVFMDVVDGYFYFLEN